MEAVDANGERCPTFQQRVDFTSPARGFGAAATTAAKPIPSTLNYLDLECGINRVSVRSLNTPGTITVTAHSGDLKPATITLDSRPVEIKDGYTLQFPPLPAPAALSRVIADDAPGAMGSETKAGTGRFLSVFSYSGPTSTVSVKEGAHDGAKIYADCDYAFQGLPTALAGCDWVQMASADKLYSAVDLLELGLNTDGDVYVAHDRSLGRPEWLQNQFSPTQITFTVNGQTMEVFQRHTQRGQSLTLGSNTEDLRAKSCNMYIVFVKRSDSSLQSAR